MRDNAGVPTEKQIKYAERVADSTGQSIPPDAYDNRVILSAWIEENTADMPKDDEGHVVFKPSMKQINLAEDIARGIASEVPSDCYNNSRAMSAWIDDHIGQYTRPATEKQINLARRIYQSDPDLPNPEPLFNDMSSLSGWIDEHKPMKWSRDR